jgi:hypothetical protein
MERSLAWLESLPKQDAAALAPQKEGPLDGRESAMAGH